MAQLLAGDIGGTKTILWLAEAQPSPDGAGIELKALHQARYVSAEYVDLVPMVRHFYAAASQQTGILPAPETACFAIAGPIVNNTSNLTNLSWLLNGEQLEQALNIQRVNLINDFAAVGYGIAGLKPSDLHTLQAGQPQANAPIGIIGAGTGLGEGFLIPAGDRYQVFPSEGGHSDFAPRNELEFQLLKYLEDKNGLSRVSVERVVSGMGIVSIYQFLRDRQFADETPDVRDAICTWEREAGKSHKTIDPGAVIAIAAAEGRDRLCQLTMQLFASAYGAEAGNLALKLLPYGGLYIAGGIAAKNIRLLESESEIAASETAIAQKAQPVSRTGVFIRAMLDKGRMRPLMEKVPVHVILNSSVGLLGAALYAAR